MLKKLSFIFLGAVTFQAHSLELDLGGLEVPAVCDAIPGLTSPIDLSPACLAAQTAAQAQPYLLPAANQLCQILEGTTATIGVIQIEVNTAIEKCQEAMLDLEQKMMFGASPQIAQFMNSMYDHYDRLSGIQSYQDLIDLARANNQLVAGLEGDEWDKVVNKSNDESKTYANKSYFDTYRDVNYMAKENLQNGGLSRQSSKVKTMLETAGTHQKVKESQDMNVRMTAELVYQQHVFQQMLAQYLQLQSARAQIDLADESANYRFFKGD